MKGFGHKQIKRDVFDSGFDKFLSRKLDNSEDNVNQNPQYVKKLLSSISGYGVNDLNGLTGEVDLVEGEGIDLTVTSATNTITIAGEEASDTNKGVASFDANHFTVTSGAVSLATDGIDDTLIDWGTDANQVSAADVPIADAGEYFATDNVEAALQAIGSGASIPNLYVKKDGTEELTANWDAGSYKITAEQIESDIATGTAPLIVASTTLVSNLNADLLDSQEGSYYLARANHTGTQAASTISDFDEAAQDAVGGMISDTNTIDLSYDDVTPALTADLKYQDTSSIDLGDDASGLKATVLPAGVDHNSLANLGTGDAHTMYVLLAGRSGGQTIIGGTDSDDDLQLQSTSNVTKGHISIPYTETLFLEGTDAIVAPTQSSSGLLMTGKTMYANRYTQPILFGSTDAQFTTNNPKFLAAIAGYATEGYAADTDSGMGISFFTTPNNDGASSTMVRVAVLDEDGKLGILNTDPTAQVDITCGSAATQGIRIAEAASQTAQPFKIENSLGNTIAGFNADGWLGIGTTIPSLSGNFICTLAGTLTGNTGTQSGFFENVTATPTANNDTNFYTLWPSITYDAAYDSSGIIAVNVGSVSIDTDNSINAAVGMLTNVSAVSGRTPTISQMKGYVMNVFTARDATVTNAITYPLILVSVDDGTVTNSYGITITQGSIDGVGSITHQKALVINDVDVGTTTNIAIETNAGNIDLNAGSDDAADFYLRTTDYEAIQTDSSDNEMWLMNNAAGKIGFFGATPVVQQTEITDELTTITYTAPGTPDYAIQDLTNSGPYGFATKDEGNTVLSIIANLQARVNEIETALVTLGLLADAD